MINKTLFTFLANGTPRPKQSARFFRGRAVSVIRSDPKKMLWKNQLEIAIQNARESEDIKSFWQPSSKEPLKLTVNFVLPTKTKGRWGLPHTSRPDADNLVKFVMDVMEDYNLLPGGDSKVSDLNVTKHWGKDGGVFVELEYLYGDDANARESAIINNPKDLEDVGIPPEWIV
tara:strand:+ start:729 stop:1247 length:519 start_codon:yes stop_codon:yes gene_type:complete